MNAQDALAQVVQYTELLMPLDGRLDDHLQVVVAGVVLECFLLVILGLKIPALSLQQNLLSVLLHRVDQQRLSCTKATIKRGPCHVQHLHKLVSFGTATLMVLFPWQQSLWLRH